VNRGSVGPPPLQRIVLYVDDLDRCPPEKVVDVLRAVHLLLALPLFVVVLAVDPRWLRRALEQHHTTLFLARDLGESQASPANYLDKIFQVPYALRPIGERAYGYIQSLLPEADQAVPTPVIGTQPTVSPAIEEPTTEEPTTPTVPGTMEVALDIPGEELDTPRLKAEPFAVSSLVRRVDDLHPEGLRISAAERDFLPRLGPLLPTPRAAKRLVNLYRLLRIGVPEAELSEFVGGEDGGPYQAAAVLLATVIGQPADARALLIELKNASPTEDILAFLRGMPTPSWHGLTNLIETIGKDTPVHVELSSYQEWGKTVARFSFETYDLFLSD